MSTTIDTLQVEIQTSSTNVAVGIRNLSAALAELKRNGTIGVATKNLKSLSDALAGFQDASRVTDFLGKLSGAMDRLKNIGSITGIANSIKKLSDNLRAIDNVNIDNVAPQIERVASALSPLSAVKAGGISTMMNGLKKLGEVTKSLDDDTIAAFTERVKKLVEVLEPLSQNMATIKTGFTAINTGAKSAGNGVKKLGDDVNTTTLNMASMITVVQGIVHALQPVVRLLTNTIDAASEWDGIAARFGRGFGTQAQETYEWIQKLNEEMGINIQQFMQYSSVYATMLTGFGVAVDDAGKMALGYTELTYDIWAGYNDIYKNFADAAEAVKSAIAGEVEPIRRAGFTIVESTLEQTAANHGLSISIEKATEAQKSYLRYLTLVDQANSQGLVGTYAKEMQTAEGVMRTFSQQLKSLAQAFGSLFLPILIRVMPWVQAFVELLADAVRGVAAFFGIEIQKVDWSGYGEGSNAIDNIADSAGTATGALDEATKAAKKLKNATLGMDELNVISPNTGSGGSGGSAGSGTGGGSAFEGLDVGSLWDDSIFDSVQFQVDKIKGKLEEALSTLTVVISGFMLAVGTILVVSGANIPVGLGLMAAGAVGLVAMAAANWNSMSDQLAKTLATVTSVVGGFLLAVGALLAFSGVNVGLGVALMAAGAISLATAATINWKFLEGDLKSTLSILTGIVAGGLLAMGALFAFTGVDVGLGIALMVAGAVGLATAVGLNWDSMSAPVRKAIGTLEAFVGSGLLAFGAVLALSGANVPLGIGMIAAGAVSLASAIALNWEAISGDLKNSLATITSIVSASLLGIGAILAITGVATALGISLIAAGAVGLVATAPINWKSLAAGVGNVLKEIGIAGGAALLALGLILVCTGVGIPLGVALIAAGATGLASGASLNWGSIVDSVKGTVNKIGEAWNGLKSKVSSAWNSVKEWWNNKEPLKEVSVKIANVKEKVSSAWTTAKNWWDNTKTALKTYTPSIGSVKDKLSSAWSSAKNWWDKSKSALAKYTPSIGSIKDKVSSAWTTAKNWWNKSRSSLSYTPSIGSIKDKVSSAWATAKSWWNKNANLSTKLNIKVPKLTVNWGEITALGKTFRYPKSFSLKFAEKGGVFDQGSFIWAGERGPEILANAGGGRTGVMNVQQMQEAVYEGVYAAVVAAMGATGGNSGSQSVNVYLDGKQITAAVEKRQHERGATIMGNQVYSY